MKKKLIFLLLLLTTTAYLSATIDLTEKINRYSGENANELNNYLDTLTGLKSYYANFVLENASDNDLAVLTPAYLEENLTYALKTFDLPYTSDIPEEYFLHFVLPLRVSQEPLENWRKPFYENMYDQVSQAQSINEAIMLADLYYQERIYFKQTSARDQGALTSIKRGYGRCEEMLILQMAILRAVGIPCRPASAPYWAFTDSNHVWTEVWTPQGWKIVPEAYPQKYRKSSWEVDRANKAPLITSQVFGKYDTEFTLRMSNNDTKLNISNVYGEVVNTKVTVIDENDNLVSGADVIYYVPTFGGLFELFSSQTDEKGTVEIDFGESSLFVLATHDGKLGTGVINTLNDNDHICITIRDGALIDENIVLNYSLDSSSNQDFGVSEADRKYLSNLTELANKRREVALLSQVKTLDFLKNYRLPSSLENQADYQSKRDQYLAKCEDLAGNTSNWLVVDESLANYQDAGLIKQIMVDLIIDWNIKDLIELADTSAIKNLLVTLTKTRKYYLQAYDYDTFRAHVINLPFNSNPFPQKDWHGELAEITTNLRDKSIDKTCKNIDRWLQENIIIDNNPSFSYFSGSLTPTELINKKYLSQNQKLYLLVAMLQNAGVPLRWQGFLEYYNGEEWLEIAWKKEEETETQEVKRSLHEFELTISNDNKNLPPEPYSNFLIASTTSSGYMSNTWFDVEQRDDKYLVKFYHEPGTQNYLQAYIRNKNGDANVIIKPISSATEIIDLNLFTPKTTQENQITWSKTTTDKVEHLLASQDITEGKTLLFVLNKQGNEPQERMLELMLNKTSEFQEKNVKLIIYSENRKITSLKNYDPEKITYLSGDKIITEDISVDNYPIIFMLENNEITTSASGFDLDLINYLLRLVD